MALALGLISSASRLALADAVVGTGSPASCTNTALNVALGIGGTITFNCGPDPISILLQSQKTIGGTVVLDGASQITLSGQGTIRPFAAIA